MIRRFTMAAAPATMRAPLLFVDAACPRGAGRKVIVVGQDRPGWQLWSVKPNPKMLIDLKDRPVAPA